MKLLLPALVLVAVTSCCCLATSRKTLMAEMDHRLEQRKLVDAGPAGDLIILGPTSSEQDLNDPDEYETPGSSVNNHHNIPRTEFCKYSGDDCPEAASVDDPDSHGN